MCKLSHNCQLVEVDQYLVQGVDITVLNLNKGNNKITELRTILQRESQNS